MPSLRNLIDDMIVVTREPEVKVTTIARALQIAGMLPTSRGKAIADVEPEHVAALITGIALAPLAKDAAEAVARYLALRPAGLPDSYPGEVLTAGDMLAGIIATIGSENPKREGMMRQTIAFGITSPAVEIRDESGAMIARFLERGTDPQRRPGVFWREASVSCALFAFLGAGNGRAGAYTWE
ncbi:hypothetical protein [Rhodobacter sp. CZR27]|uniref:hypothetical protein n=1 Tax=Rhodobacter sp. CZR27 TaxID=2033869 RepID=UPI000BBE1CA3|nr:hypothetical protein [Rhodobacter sp. CZR27]